MIDVSAYSQLSRKRPPFVHGKVIVYGKNQQNKPKTESIKKLHKIIAFAAKIRPTHNDTLIKTILFLVFASRLACFARALRSSAEF